MPDMAYAKKWLEYAQKDYDFAVKIEKHFWPKDLEQICYHCQQGAEKALKAVLAYNEVDIPKIHVIGKLMEACKQFDETFQMDRKIANVMTGYATLSRYPDNMNDWTEGDAKLAIKYAGITLDMVKQYLEKIQRNAGAS